MKWFWYSLIGFCILMCSCKTKESAHLINEASKENVQTGLNKFEVLVDTSRIYKFGVDKSKLTITETITTKKYDKDTGIVTEETKTEREITQDSDKVVSEEENQSVTNCNGLELKQDIKSEQNIESEVKEESGSVLGAFWEQLGKSLGIILGLALVIGIFGRYLAKKLRVN